MIRHYLKILSEILVEAKKCMPINIGESFTIGIATTYYYGMYER